MNNTDALNLQTADSRYYADTVTLDNIEVPLAALSMNTHKITDLADPSANQDAVTLYYL